MAASKKIPASEYRRCAEAGMSQAEAARALGVSISSVWHAAAALGLRFRDGRGRLTRQPKPVGAAPEPMLAQAREGLAFWRGQEAEARRQCERFERIERALAFLDGEGE